MIGQFNIAICTPTTGSVKASYTASLLGMVTHFLSNPVYGLEEYSRSITYNLIIGSNISMQRDSMVEEALADKTVTHVLFIDDDMGFQADALNIALADEQPIILANYRRKAPPWAFTARNIDAEGRAHEVVTDDLKRGTEAVTFGGFGFCLIEVDILRKIQKPRFLNRWIEHQQLYSTEDYPFFKAILDKKLAQVYVDHDLSQLVFHVGDFRYAFDTAPVIQQ